MYKSIGLLYSNNKISERETKEPIPFTTVSKTITYLELAYIRRQKACTSKTVKMLVKETKDSTKRMGRYTVLLE